MRLTDTIRNCRSLVILTAVLTVLGSYWGEIRSATEQALVSADRVKQAQKEAPLLAFDQAKVTSLRIRRGRDPVMTVKRQTDDEWILESPFRARADAYLVDRTLTALSFIPVAQTVSRDSGSLSEFGLGPEGLPTTVTIGTDRTEDWVEIGGSSVNGTMRYARSSAREDIVLIEEKQLQAIPLHVGELLDCRIFPLAQEPLRAIESKEGTKSMLLQAGGSGWTIQSPVRVSADVQVMTEWLRQLASMNALDVRPSAQRTGQGSPGRRIGSLKMEAGRVAVTTDLFRVQEKIVAYRSDQPSLEFELSPGQLPMIFPDPFTLRDKHLVQAELREIAFVEFLRQGGSIRIARTMSGWTRDDRLLSRDQSDAMDRWLTELRLSEGSQLLPAPARCKTNPASRWELRLHSFDGRVLGRLALARTPTCGDVATLPSGEWIQLRGTALIDQIPARRG